MGLRTALEERKSQRSAAVRVRREKSRPPGRITKKRQKKREKRRKGARKGWRKDTKRLGWARLTE